MVDDCYFGMISGNGYRRHIVGICISRALGGVEACMTCWIDKVNRSSLFCANTLLVTSAHYSSALRLSDR